MALYGIIADIHGNKEAFVAVLHDLAARRVDRIVCLGDIIGYNADSNECVRLIEENRIESIFGNHEEIALGRMGFENCCDAVKFSLKQTMRDLDEYSRSFLGTLPAWRLYEGSVITIHGGYGDAGEYLIGKERILENYRRLLARFECVPKVCFFGHTHARIVYGIENGTVRDLGAGDFVNIDSRSMYFVNPGSVDASRREGPRLAEYATYETDRHVVAFHQVPYDHVLTEQKAVRDGYRIDRIHSFLYRVKRKYLP